MYQAAMDAPPLHIAMYPWLAVGHITPFLQLSSKLAKRGHRISFFIPTRTKSKLQHLNLHPNLITFVPITIPFVEGLPQGAETTFDLPPSLYPLLMTAMDRTEKEIEGLLLQLKPNLVFFDFAHWLPNLAQRVGIKSVQYWVLFLASAAYVESTKTQDLGSNDRCGFVDSSIKLHVHEQQILDKLKDFEFGSGLRFFDRIDLGRNSSNAVAFKSCREIEGPYADYLETLYGKPVLLSGLVLPEPSTSTLEQKWADWLGEFTAGSVIYCKLGSECILQPNEFQELLLGLELSGMPFLAALKAPNGFDSVEAALPKGFEERVKGRGVVHGGWLQQQQLILEHPSVGCFITHCGSGSLQEGLLSQCQLVLLPIMFDQIIVAKMVSKSLKAGVEVEKGEEDGLFTKQSVCKALRIVMNEESEVAKEIKTNHAKLRSLLLSDNFESNYVDNFCRELQHLFN